MSKEKLDTLKTRLETKTNILYNELVNVASVHATVDLFNRNFKHGTLIIAPDYFIWTNDTGDLEKKIGPTKNCSFVLRENIVFNPNDLRNTALEDAKLNLSGAQGTSDGSYDLWNERTQFWETAVTNYDNYLNGAAASTHLVEGKNIGPGSNQNYTIDTRYFAKAGRVRDSAPDNVYYDRRSFGIGFFSAICIHAHNIIVDLNGFSIRQSDEHALNQRFFSVIELASVPFITGQGPHDFGDKLQYANRCMIHNGTIGRSSHHGIHGNLCRDIIIKDINFENYEVAAVALNGARNISLIDLDLRGTSKKVPIKGIFSAGRFIWEYMKEIETHNNTAGDGSKGGATDSNDAINPLWRGATLTIAGTAQTDTKTMEYLENLIKQVNTTFLDLNTGNFVSSLPTTFTAAAGYVFGNTAAGVANALFINQNKRSDGNSYGILFNQTGVAVKGFPKNRDNPSENILLNNINVQGQVGWVNEIPVLLDASGKKIVDPIGSVFQTYHNTDASGKYIGNPVSNSQLIVTKARNRVNPPVLFFGAGGDQCHCIRGLNIPDQIIENVSGGLPIYNADSAGNNHFGYQLNGDSMAHVNKGIISFKLDAVENLVAVNCTTSSTINITGDYAIIKKNLNEWNPTKVVGGNYEMYSKGLATSSVASTYRGNNVHVARGWSLASSKNCYLIDCVARNVQSYLGRAYGFDIHQDTDNVFLMNCQAYGIRGGTKLKSADLCVNDDALRMMENPKSIGIRVGQDTTNITLYNCGVDGTFDAIYGDWVKKFEILSEDVVISHKC